MLAISGNLHSDTLPVLPKAKQMALGEIQKVKKEKWY